MHGLLMALAILGWVLLGLLGLMLVLLLMPVGVAAEWSPRGFSAKLLVFCVVPIRLFPRRPAKPRKKKPVAEKTAPREQMAASEPSKLPKLTLEQICALVSTAGKAMRIAFGGLWFTGIRVVWTVHEPEPAETATAYGRAQAYLNGSIATLCNFLHLRFKQAQLLADFEGNLSDRRFFYCKVVSIPLIMLIAGAYVLIHLKEENIL